MFIWTLGRGSQDEVRNSTLIFSGGLGQLIFGTCNREMFSECCLLVTFAPKSGLKSGGLMGPPCAHAQIC